MSKEPDPTKEPGFQKVVKHFLNTPPQPRVKPEVKEGESKKRGRPAKNKGESLPKQGSA